ncbi:hypothetical protein GGI07_003184 [Coemansia sp. Benny D115]|nr:hypothetical protein GGI07_003184 [Coemansia sp. Benny D115]
MNVSTRTRAKTAESAAAPSSKQQHTQRKESSASQPSPTASKRAQPHAVDEPGSSAELTSADKTMLDEDTEHDNDPEATPTTSVAPEKGASADALISIPTQNIRQFKEAVVNTSRLLKVFSDQEKELAKTKAELAKVMEDSKKLSSSYQLLQREAESRMRELTKAKNETESTRQLVLQREEELSRARGQKEDLEARVQELSRVASASSPADQQRDSQQKAAAESPNVELLEEIERLKRDLEAKEGSLKSMRISRDSIRSSTKAEVMSIQAKYAREQMELIEQHERDMSQFRRSLASREADLEQEQERLMQLEMDQSMRTTQLEDQVADLKANVDALTAKNEAAQKTIRSLEEAAKTRAAENRAEITRLTRAAKRDEKRVQELTASLERAHSRERDAKQQKPRPRPKSTAAEAGAAAIADVVSMDVEELRAEVTSLRVDAVHKDETIRRLEVMVQELERKQNPEGRRPRGRVAVLEAELEKQQAEGELKQRRIEALEAALHISENSNNGNTESTEDTAAAIAQRDLRVIALEAQLRDGERQIKELERALEAARESANERPMRLRHAAAATTGVSTTATSSQTRQTPTQAKIEATAALRATVAKLQRDRAALQELVTEQQVTIHQLRNGSNVNGNGSGAIGVQAPENTHPKKRVLLPDSAAQPSDSSVDEVEQAGVLLPKRPRHSNAAAVVRNGGRSTDQVAGEQQTAPQPHTTGESNAAVVLSSVPVPSTNGIGAAPGSKATTAAQMVPVAAEVTDGESMAKVLRDKRISSVNRTRKFFAMLIRSPQMLTKSLLDMHDAVPPLDAAEYVRLQKQHTTGGSDIPSLLMPSPEQVSTPQGIYPAEADIAECLWTLCFKHGQGEFFQQLLRLLAQGIVAPENGVSVATTCSQTRIFAALSQRAGDIQRVRVLLCDLLMDAVDSEHTLPVLSNALAVWPAVLTSPSQTQSDDDDAASFGLVVRVVQAIAAGIHDLYTEEHGRTEADALYSVMVERCGWRPPAEAEFADRILVEVRSTLDVLDRESNNYAVVMCAHNLLAPYITDAEPVAVV